MAYQYILGGASPCDQHGIPFSAEVPPLSTEVMNGNATTDGATILTIPANTTIKCWITLSASLNATKTNATPSVTLTGTGSPSPASGAVLAMLSISTSTGNPTAATAAQFSNIWIYSGTQAVTLKLNYNTASSVAVVVNGYVVT